MAKLILDQLREHLEDVEHAWLYFFTMILFLSIIAGITLFGVYLYTKH